MISTQRTLLSALILILGLLLPSLSLAGQYQVYRVIDGDHKRNLDFSGCNFWEDTEKVEA